MNRFTQLMFAGAVALGLSAPAAMAADDAHGKSPTRQSWSFAGPFGKFDQAQLQRGFQVFREVCARCHSAKYLSFRNLGEEGGPEFSEGQIKALAAEYKIQDGPDESGKMFERAGRPADRFPWSFPNPEAAKSALGAVPPDLSVMAKARGYSRGFPMFLLDSVIQYQEHGVDYIYALLNGYSDAKDLNHNDYFPGGRIGMARPLSDGDVTWERAPGDDHAPLPPQTVQQYAKDVSAFLMWLAEPKLEERKRYGFNVMVFLIVLAGLTYLTKKKVWADAH
jgi:cytochrome c1